MVVDRQRDGCRQWQSIVLEARRFQRAIRREIVLLLAGTHVAGQKVGLPVHSESDPEGIIAIDDNLTSCSRLRW